MPQRREYEVLPDATFPPDVEARIEAAVAQADKDVPSRFRAPHPVVGMHFTNEDMAPGEVVRVDEVHQVVTLRWLEPDGGGPPYESEWAMEEWRLRCWVRP